MTSPPPAQPPAAQPLPVAQPVPVSQRSGSGRAIGAPQPMPSAGAAAAVAGSPGPEAPTVPAAFASGPVAQPPSANPAGPPPPGGQGGPPITPLWVATHQATADLDPRLILVRQPDSARAAAFRVLRHRLGERAGLRTIVVTSACPGEGKTTCAVNLALALGECRRARVLLIEANLRTPALAGLFGSMQPECFSTQLTRHREQPLEPWSVVEVFAPSSVHVLAVHPSNAGKPLLDGPAFAIAMDRLRGAGYEYIVIDTPPVLGAADVNLIQDVADGVLLTTRSALSSARTLRQAMDQLQPAKILGVVMVE